MQRRQFIKKGCFLCAGIAGGVLTTSLLNSCSPIHYYKTTSSEKKIRVPLTNFIENNFLIVSASDFKYEIALIKQSNNEFHSFVMQCTHASNYLTFNGTQFNCNLHGSAFKRNGEVEKGPAEKPLVSLRTEKNGEEIVIFLV